MKYYFFILVSLFFASLTFLDSFFPIIGFSGLTLLNFFSKRLSFNEVQLNKAQIILLTIILLSLICYVYRMIFNNGILF